MKRRELIEKALFGTGYVGLRALATGLPAWMFARPVEASFGTALYLRGVTVERDPGRIILTPAWDMRAAPTGDFRPSPSRLCDYCDHKAFCPAFDGTPPPYPGWPEPDDTEPLQDRD